MTGLWLLRFSPHFIAGPLGLVKKLGWGPATAPVQSPAAAVESEPKSGDEQATTISAPNQDRSPIPVESRHIPRSLYPPAIVGLAMIAREEIGFLIASVAEAHGIFSPHSAHSSGPSIGSSELYLIVVWAAVLCTMLGPVAMGLCVRRVKALEKGGAGTRVLGAWGIKQE